MSNSALLDTMAQQADAQRARIAEDARAEADRILEQGRLASAAHRETVWQVVKAEEAHKERMSRQFANVEADKTRLAARNWAFEEVMIAVRRELERIVDSDEFPKILGRLLEEALDAATGPVIVEAPASHVDAVRAMIQGRYPDVQEVVASRTIRDGVAVWNPERSVRILNTLSERRAIVEEAARKHVFQKLFKTAG